MKKLNVKWLETSAIGILTISTVPSAENCAALADEFSPESQTGIPGKLIIISDGSELRANVATLQ